jgi:hypothetical protein
MKDPSTELGLKLVKNRYRSEVTFLGAVCLTF